MKKFLALTAAMSLAATTAFAASFAPTIMTLSAAQNVYYGFDGSSLTLPVTVAGTPASVAFLVYTQDKGAAIGTVKNGYLGWHYVNKIDTCIYAAPFTTLSKGSNAIVWDGKDKDGKMVSAGVYTYYIWGINNVTARTKMTSVISLGWESRDFVQTHGENGAVLAQPVVWTASYQGQATTDQVDYIRNKWIIGNDPDDATLKETCTYKTIAENSSMAFDPTNNKYFFNEYLNNNGQLVVRKMEWVPNGTAVQQTDWGQDNGQTSWDTSLTPGWAYMGGAVSDGADLLMFANGDLSDAGTESNIVFMNVADGSIAKKLDTSNWWVDINDGEQGGQTNGGPSDLVFLKGRLHASSHASCIDQCINPYADDDADATIWVNQNGDYTGDHNFEETSEKKWVCNDYNVGPYKYQATMDDNFFTSFSAYDMGAVTFGLYGPDGTGLGYVALSGETSGFKGGQYVVDYGSMYDGYYSDNASSADASSQGGWWFSGHDSIKGTISNQVGVASAAPAAFAVAQNSPNPFNPTTTISFTLAKAGKTTVDVYNVAGQKISTLVNSSLSAGSHSVTWNAAKFSAGVYFYTVKSGDFSKTMKMTLLK